MPRTLVRLPIALCLACAVLLPLTVPVAASPGVNGAIIGTPIRSVYVRPPRASAATQGKPVQVLLALHGMGGNGESFSKDLIEQADRYGWLLVAPTIEYG